MALSPEPGITRECIAALLEKMAVRRIAVLGDAMLDVYVSGDADQISPEAPIPVVTVRTRRQVLGGAANVAANVAAIGAECRLVAVVGDDPGGDLLRTELAFNRLSSQYLIVAKGRLTTLKTRVTARGQQVVRIDEEVDDPIPPEIEEQVRARLRDAVADADALLVEDYNKGTLTLVVIELAMAIAREHHLPVIVDPKFKNFYAYRGATVFKPNRQELEQAAGAALDLTEPQALPETREKLGVENLLLTLGRDGMVLVTKDGHLWRIPAIAREVFDVSGAGDTVTAWVGTALAAGASVREAAHLATYAAGVEVGKSGVATVLPAEVLRAHQSSHGPFREL